MKFKMAPNSLFAVLLRSPWWISFLIFGMLVAAAFALVPLEYRVLASMGGLPFFVIGCIALWQQMRLPSAGRSEEIVLAASSMNWTEFSKALEDGFSRQGYSVERLKGVADFSLQRKGLTTLVGARRWKAAHHGEDALQALHAAAEAQGASNCLYVTVGELSGNALAYAKRQNIQLMQGAALAFLLQHTQLRR